MTLISRLLLSGFCALLPVLALAAPVELVAHRAAYEISLGKQRASASDVVDASGKVIFSQSKTCDGWIYEQDHQMNIYLEDGNIVPEAVQFSSWESDDGQRYRYSIATQSDPEGTILGDAVLANGGGVAVFKKPEAATFDLPPGTLFPMAHSKALLAHARNGTDLFNATVFEGTDVEGAKLLVAFISPLADGEWRKLGPMMQVEGWTVRMAYFDPTSPTPEPMYEIEADFLENGISPRWLLDYGTFSVEMKIRQIEVLAKPDC